MFKNRFLLVLGLLSLLLVAMAVALPPAHAPTNSAIQRGRAADTARWTAIGTYYQHLAGIPSLSRAQSADAARWTAMSQYYLQLAEAQAQSLERGRAADVTRWTAMAQCYAQMDGETE